MSQSQPVGLFSLPGWSHGSPAGWLLVGPEKDRTVRSFVSAAIYSFFPTPQVGGGGKERMDKIAKKKQKVWHLEANVKKMILHSH